MPFRLILTSAVALALMVAPAWTDDEVPKVSGSGVLVLDDADPDFKDKAAYEDNLFYIGADGKQIFKVSGINGCQTIGSNHMIAADPQRGWCWVLEMVGKRIRKIDRAGNELLVIEGIEASSVAVDPTTGNLWVAYSKRTIHGDQTVAYDVNGQRLFGFAVGGWDIAYDAKSKSFWLASNNLIKIDAQSGTVRFTKQIAQWCASSIDVHQATGKVWVTVRRHPDVANSANQLLALDNDGTLAHTIDLGDNLANHEKSPFRVSVNQRDGSVWVTLLRSGVQHYSSAGEKVSETIMYALAAEADPASDAAWVATPQGLVRLSPAGKIVERFPHAIGPSQAWIAAFPAPDK